MLTIVQNSDGTTWLLNVADGMNPVHLIHLPEPSDLYNAVRRVLLRRCWAISELDVSLSTEDHTGLRAFLKRGTLTVSVVDCLGSVSPTRHPFSLEEFASLFEEISTTSDSDPSLAQIAMFVTGQSLVTKTEDPVLTPPTKCQVHDWPKVASSETFKVAYHRTWSWPRELTGAVTLDDGSLATNSSTGITVLDSLSGDETSSHLGAIIPSGFPAGLGLDKDGRVFTFDGSGLRQRLDALDNIAPLAGAAGAHNEWNIWSDSGALFTLDRPTGRLRWRIDPTTGESPMALSSVNQVWMTDSTGVLSQYSQQDGSLTGRVYLDGVVQFWKAHADDLLLVVQQVPGLTFSVTCLDRSLKTRWTRRFESALVAEPAWTEDRIILAISSGKRSTVCHLRARNGHVQKHHDAPVQRIHSISHMGDYLVVVGEHGETAWTHIDELMAWRCMLPINENSRVIPRFTDRGDFWVVDHDSVELFMPQTGSWLGQVAGRPCENVHPLTNGDLLIIFDDCISRYRLGGYLSIVPG